jgi:hypothetical protein
MPPGIRLKVVQKPELALPFAKEMDWDSDVPQGQGGIFSFNLLPQNPVTDKCKAALHPREMRWCFRSTAFPGLGNGETCLLSQSRFPVTASLIAAATLSEERSRLAHGLTAVLCNRPMPSFCLNLG